MAKSSIEWTDATWNPVTGCTRVSRGCDLCYAATLTRRLAGMGNEKYQGLINAGKGHFNGVVKIHPGALSLPYATSKRTKFFVNSMSDLFHKEVPVSFILDVFEVMARTPQHVYQILTKRPERMRELMPEIWEGLAARVAGGDGCIEIPLTNVWLGTSVEDADVVHRVDDLRETAAAVRFLSCEPLLGPLDDLGLSGIDWVIVGGESGKGARPMRLNWVESIIEQCQTADVACFVKQLGAKPVRPAQHIDGHDYTLPLKHAKGGDPKEWPLHLRVRKFPETLSPA